MKRLVLAVAAVVALAACAKKEEAPMADSPAAAVAPTADTPHVAADSVGKTDSTAKKDTSKM